MTEVQPQPAKSSTGPSSSSIDAGGVQITGLEVLQQPPAEGRSRSQAQVLPKGRGKAALSPVRPQKSKIQRKKMPPKKTKSCPQGFATPDEGSQEQQQQKKGGKLSPMRPAQTSNNNTRQAIQHQPLARVTRRGSMGGVMAAQPVAAGAAPVYVQPQQQRPLARVPRRSSMGAAPGYGHHAPQPAPVQAQQQQQQQQQQQHRQMRRNSVGGVRQLRRGSVGGAQALPRVSRRVSIGNQEVGVEQVRWGQKPQRRSSLNNTSNYQYAPTAQVQPPQSQVQCHYGYQDMNDISNSSDLTNSHAGNHHHEHNDSFDFSRRSSLSSHDSRFVENSRGIFQRNPDLGYNDDDDSFASSCYSYANDSVDIRNKGKKGKEPQKGQLDSFISADSAKHRQRTKRQMPVRAVQPRRFSNDSYGSLGSSSCGDTYAADSLDLRRKPKATRRVVNDDDDDDDSFDSSCGSTYAADSIDLRRNSKLRQKPAAVAAATPVCADDLGYGDARPTSANNVDLGYGDARPSAAVVDDDDDDDVDDSFTSSCYSYANDSIDMRQMRKQHAARVAKVPDDEDLGYGDARPSSAQAADLGYGDARPSSAQVADLGYGNARPSSVQAADLGYGDALPAADLGYGDARPSSAQAADLGYGDARPSSAQAADLGYGDARPSSAQAADLGYGDVRPSSRAAPRYDEDDDDDYDSCDSGAFSYANDSVDMRQMRKKHMAATAVPDNDLGYGDARPSSAHAADLGYGDARPSSAQMDDLGYGDAKPCSAQADDDDLGYGDAAPSRREYVDDDDDMDSGAESSYASYSYAADSIDLRAKRRTATTTNMDDEDDDEEEEVDSGRTPVDYMTQVVMGYCNKPEGARRDSLESVGDESCYSYACNSVDLRPKKLQPRVASANKESYDDDSEDYSDDDSSRGGNPYLNGGRLGKPSGLTGSKMERPVSPCNSIANDSVDLRKFGLKKKPVGGLRRTSMDSLDSDASSKFSGGDLDPEYLHNVLGYAMDASSNSLDIPDNVVAVPPPNDMSKRDSIGSVTSMHSDDDDDDDDDNSAEENQPAIPKRTLSAVDNPKTLERCHSQPMLGKHNKMYADSSCSDNSCSHDWTGESSDDDFNYLPNLEGFNKAKTDQLKTQTKVTENVTSDAEQKADAAKYDTVVNPKDNIVEKQRTLDSNTDPVRMSVLCTKRAV